MHIQFMHCHIKGVAVGWASSLVNSSVAMEGLGAAAPGGGPHSSCPTRGGDNSTHSRKGNVSAIDVGDIQQEA